LGFDSDLNLGNSASSDGFAGVFGLGGGRVAYWALRLLRPAEWLVTTSRFAGMVSTVAIKTVDRGWRCSSNLSMSRSCCHSALALTLLLCCCVWPSAILCVCESDGTLQPS
jgi:hypothetical protein